MNIKRKKFFSTIGTGLLSLIAAKLIPFTGLLNKSSPKSKTIKVKINPDAVSRDNNGKKND
ncbi:MAG: hypothetical protein KJO12_04485 [Ignavibacteria bacterium]|nr:hypothetical protein [Ignavibacteria bacterium]